MKLGLPARLSLSLLAALAVSAANNVSEYNARIWQSDEGLPLDAVRAVAQTPDGFIWVGTQVGLSRFDGTHFTLIDDRFAPEMTGANVSGLRVTRDGTLWIATRDRGIVQLKDGRFRHYGQKEGLPGNICLGSIFEDSKGAVWVGTLKGLARFKDGVISTISRTVIQSVCEDLSSNLWFATANGVDCWSNNRVVAHLSGSDGLPNANVRAICCGPDGSIWVGTGDEVRHIVQGQAKVFLKSEGANYNLVTALYFDRRGTFWVGTYDGLNRIVDGHFVPELNIDGLPYGAVVQMSEDREDNLWVCAKDGLIRLKPNRILCYTQQQGLANDNVSSVLEDSTGAICIGTWGGGVIRLRDGAITPYRNSISYPRLVLGMREDTSGRFWVGTDYNEGLYELNGKGPRHFNQGNGAELPAIRVIYQDHSSKLWVGTSDGLFHLQGRHLALDSNSIVSSEEVIRSIDEDHDGNLWFGTQNGVVRNHNGDWRRFTTKDGLANNRVVAIYEDSGKSLWIGALEGGLTRYRSNTFTRYSIHNGLFSDQVSSIIEDDNGWLWMGGDHGIFRVNRKNFDAYDRGEAPNLRSISYGKTDGMVNKICNGIAKPNAWKSRDGRLWFATIKGVCVVDPKKTVLAESPAPPVVIEELHSGQQSFFDPIDPLTFVRLQPGSGELEFQYAALGFRAPEENHYKYKLSGVDSAWVDAGARQIAHYDNIYPGHYKFQVIACNSDNVWNMTGDEVEIFVAPHLWQTRWFQFTALSIGAAGLAILYRFYLLRRREIERLRVRIAADLHDEIGSNLASIALLSQLGQKHEDKQVRAELSEIYRIALLTVNGLREIVWFINRDFDTMPEMIARMKEVAGQMLIGINYSFDVAPGFRGGKLSPEFRRNLMLIFKEILHNVVKHAQASRVEIELCEAKGIFVLGVVDNGRGFNPATVTAGNGLKNLRLRAGQLGGQVEIARSTDGGTFIIVSVKIT